MRVKALFGGIIVTLLAAVAPQVAGAAGPPGHSGSNAPVYYLSLGDSLSVGYQPVPPPPSPTNQGYADDIYNYYRAQLPNLQLVKMGCPGETTTTMIYGGGPCTYDHGSQLAQAVSFLHAHSKFTVLVTIDIGANNVDNCVSPSGIDLGCVTTGIATATSDMGVLLPALTKAASSFTKIVGMNYYDPYLAAWLTTGSFNPLASESLTLTNDYNGILDASYALNHIPVANVQDAFLTNDITPPSFPADVAAICEWTWMCTLMNIHANQAGYAVIAQAFEAAIGTLSG